MTISQFSKVSSNFFNVCIERLLYWLDCLVGRKPAYFWQSWQQTLRVDQTTKGTKLSFGGKVYQSLFSNDTQLPNTVWSCFLLAPLFQSKPSSKSKILILGFGGGVAAVQYSRYFPTFVITGVEIDHRVISVAHQFFDLPDQTNIICTDANTYVRQTTEKYEIVIVDLFDRDKSIDLVHQEDFLSQVLRMVADNGVIVINFLGKPTDKRAIIRFFKQQAKNLFTLEVATADIQNTEFFITNSLLSLETIKEHIKQLPDSPLKRFAEQSSGFIKQL